MEEDAEGALPLDLVVTADGLFALGSDDTESVRNQGRDTVVWHSDDGVTWSVAAAIPDVAAEAMAAGPDGLVIAGTSIPDEGKWIRAVWRSVDGSDWQMEPLEVGGPRPAAVAIADEGTVLVRGHNYAHGKRSRTRLWRSEGDGSWESVDLPGGLPFDTTALMRGPVATPRGFLLTTREDELPAEQLWHSPDGREWSEIPMPPGWNAERSFEIVQPWPYPNLGVSSRTAWDDIRLSSLLLTSDGGETWCISEGPMTDEVRMMDVAVAPDGGIVAFGDLRFSPRAWSIRPLADSDGDPFPCQPVPARELPGFADEPTRDTRGLSRQ